VNRHVLDDVAELVDMDFRAFLKVKKPYMTTEQVKELSDKGFLIGSHSKDHPLFGKISPDERILQYRESMEYIQREIKPGYGLFSFPFTDAGVPEKFLNDIRKEGMPGLDASFASAGLKKDPVPGHYQRIPMEAGRAGAGRLIRGEYLYFLAKSPTGKNLISRE
jgi:peptidoglycan/xylan/chitin deacetylase (PgdA/CDA1 family)